MLSDDFNIFYPGESAKGKYPVQSILMMDKILEQTEQYGKMHNNSVVVKPDGLCSNQGMAYVSNSISYFHYVTLCCH